MASNQIHAYLQRGETRDIGILRQENGGNLTEN